MKLLPKTEINARKAEAQRQAIDEGVKITKRIDSLREVMAAEEQSLEKFRRETLENIHKETTAAAEERDALLGEVRELKIAREKALQPLTEELKLLDEAREELAAKAALNASQALTNDTRSQELNERERVIRSLEEKATQREERTIEELTEATRQKEMAEQLNTEAAKNYEQSVILKEQTESSIAERLSQLESKESQLKIIEQQLLLEQQFIAEEKIRLADREQTLEREFNRLKKKQ